MFRCVSLSTKDVIKLQWFSQIDMINIGYYTGTFCYFHWKYFCCSILMWALGPKLILIFRQSACWQWSSHKPGWRLPLPSTLSEVITRESQWRESWKSAPVVNAHLVDDPTIRQPGFTLPWQQWSLLNHFRTSQGHCGASRKSWCLTDTDLCSCGETQMMSHIVESCPLTKLNGGLSLLHSAGDAAIAWLTNYGS